MKKTLLKWSKFAIFSFTLSTVRGVLLYLFIPAIFSNLSLFGVDLTLDQAKDICSGSIPEDLNMISEEVYSRLIGFCITPRIIALWSASFSFILTILSITVYYITKKKIKSDSKPL